MKASELKKKYKFMLIGSGGVNTSFEVAKALALGADFTASARVILQTLEKEGQVDHTGAGTEAVHFYVSSLRALR